MGTPSGVWVYTPFIGTALGARCRPTLHPRSRQDGHRRWLQSGCTSQQDDMTGQLPVIAKAVMCSPCNCMLTQNDLTN